jgi:sugar phosphate isomerase/epimerase
MKRKEFLKLGGCLAVTGLAANRLTDIFTDNTGAKKIKSFGLQLYTLRDDFPQDPKGVLKQVAGFGYKQVESFEGPKGIFWGMTNKEFKTYMDELGMTIVSSHCDVNKDFEKKAAEAAEIGMKYLICPWLGPQKKLDDYKKFADTFNRKGEICKKNGIRFAYHNHDYSFKELEGQIPQELMMNSTDPSLVDYEMDIYWVETAKAKTEDWLKKYKNRFRLCHIKDREKNTTETFASCTLGEGSINFARLLKTARQNGMKYFIVEQEKYAGTTPLKAVEANAKYMKMLSI